MAKNKYLIAAAGTLLLLLVGAFFAWSLFRVYISELFPLWTSANMSLNFSLFVVVFCFGSLFSGSTCKRLGCDRIIRIAALLMAVGMVGVSLVGKMSSGLGLICMYVFYGGFGGFSVGMVYNAVLSGVTRWFPGRSGSVSGLLLTGYGLGSLVCGSAISAAADAVGFWIAFLLAGAVMVPVLIVCSFLFKAAPEEVKAEAGQTGLTTSKMLKTPAFWFLFCWGLFTGCVGLMVINSAAVIALTFGVAAVLGLLVSLFNGFGRIVSGIVYDRLKYKSTFIVIIVAFASGISLIAAYHTDSKALMFAGMLLAGLSYGCTMAIIAALIRDFFGMKHYSSNFAVVTMAGIPSSLIGPVVSGMLQDAAGGSYLTTFWAMIAFAFIGLVCNVGMSLTKNKIINE